MYTLDYANVEKLFVDCLFTAEEVEAANGADEAVRTLGAVANGVITNVAFHKAKIEKNKDKIIELIQQLPDKLKDGMSFLEMCQTREGVNWGDHHSMDQLVCLGLAADQLKECSPRELRPALPGGVPYYQST